MWASRPVCRCLVFVPLSAVVIWLVEHRIDRHTEEFVTMVTAPGKDCRAKLNGSQIKQAAFLNHAGKIFETVIKKKSAYVVLSALGCRYELSH